MCRPEYIETLTWDSPTPGRWRLRGECLLCGHLIVSVDLPCQPTSWHWGIAVEQKLKAAFPEACNADGLALKRAADAEYARQMSFPGDERNFDLFHEHLTAFRNWQRQVYPTLTRA